ncbi:TetR/AcrR family transcriptional regulator [Frondihabitans cladoniiphilus]|uniref:HTH tetR-type domain-containing protein n=1 Tax=Frondihabitans cladoniiphilus TaxID=715785 RepID=A0ABP8W5X7_9MICO
METPAVDAPRALGLDVRGRIEIVEGAIRTFASRGYRATTREDIALELGITVDEILSQFPSWPGLLLAVIDRWNNHRLLAVQRAVGDRGTLEFMRELIEHNVREPGLMRLLVGVSSEAADPTHPAAPYFRERYQLFHELIEAGIQNDVDRGLAPTGLVPSIMADQLIALYEGLQLQAMLRPEMDLAASFNRAVKYLTQGW